jgi:hypothetical protein
MFIESYDFGKIKADGRVFDRDVMILPNENILPWVKKRSHYIDAEELSEMEQVFKIKPEVLIIGIGYHGIFMVGADIEKFLKSKNIELIIEKTSEAWKTYNKLIATKKVAALLHLTC